MENKIDYKDWSKFIQIFNDRYKGSPTRFGIFEREDHVTNDYWIESGLPLGGVDMDSRGPLPTFRVDMGSYSHEIENVLKITIKLTASGEEDGIDILDDNGRTTVLRIEASFPEQ